MLRITNNRWCNLSLSLSLSLFLCACVSNQSNLWYSTPVGTANLYTEGSVATAFPTMQPTQLICVVQQKIDGSAIAISDKSTTLTFVNKSASSTLNGVFQSKDQNYDVMGHYVNNGGCYDNWVLNQTNVLGPHQVYEGSCVRKTFALGSVNDILPRPM
jgi:hypothetical protein